MLRERENNAHPGLEDGRKQGRKLKRREQNTETEVLYIKVKISRLYLKRTFPLNPKNKTRKARKPHHM